MPRARPERPPLRVFPTTLWEYPSQHYDWVDADGRRHSMQGDKDYAGATPSWVIWQLLMRYTRETGDPLQRDHVRRAIAGAEAALGREGRIVIRPSGTEPVIRVMAEASDPVLVRRSVDDIIAALEAGAAVG